MGSFTNELDSLWRKKEKELKRHLTKEEGENLKEELFIEWIDNDRIDDAIKRVLYKYGREGGEREIFLVTYKLNETLDADKIHSFYQALLSRRFRGYTEFWPKAKQGHIGSMYQASKHMADTMEIYLWYFDSLDQLGLENAKVQIKKEMILFQNHKLPNSFKPGQVITEINDPS